MSNNGPVEAKDLTPAVLEQLYVHEKLSTVEIGKRYGVSSETVRRRMRKHGILRRTLSAASSGELNSNYKDGSRAGGYKRKGYNPWNKGKTKRTSRKVNQVAETIREAMRGHPAAFKSREEWTFEDCVHHTSVTATSLRSREDSKYIEALALLGSEWVAEHFEADFVSRREDGLWQGFIVDLANPSRKEAIEVDGGYHEHPCQGALDKNRDRKLRDLGWRVYRVASEQDLRDLATLLHA